ELHAADVDDVAFREPCGLDAGAVDRDRAAGALDPEAFRAERLDLRLDGGDPGQLDPNRAVGSGADRASLAADEGDLGPGRRSVDDGDVSHSSWTRAATRAGHGRGGRVWQRAPGRATRHCAARG